MDVEKIKGYILSFLVKLLNKIYVKYLKQFYGTVDLGKHVMIDYRCEISHKKNISIAENSILYKHTTIYKHKEGYFKMGEFSHVAPYGYFLIEKQHLSIGNNVTIGPFCSIFCSSNSIPLEQGILFKESYNKGDVSIGDNVFIGAQCVILPGTVIENNVVVAANSTVKGTLLSGYIYGGNPARKIKKVFE